MFSHILQCYCVPIILTSLQDMLAHISKRKTLIISSLLECYNIILGGCIYNLYCSCEIPSFANFLFHRPPVSIVSTVPLISLCFTIVFVENDIKENL